MYVKVWDNLLIFKHNLSFESQDNSSKYRNVKISIYNRPANQ